MADGDRQNTLSCTPSRQNATTTWKRRYWSISTCKTAIIRLHKTAIRLLSTYAITLSPAKLSPSVYLEAVCVRTLLDQSVCIYWAKYVWERNKGDTTTKGGREPQRPSRNRFKRNQEALSSFKFCPWEGVCTATLAALPVSQKTSASECFKALCKQVLICYLCEKLQLNGGMTSYDQRWRGTWWFGMLLALGYHYAMAESFLLAALFSNTLIKELHSESHKERNIIERHDIMGQAICETMDVTLSSDSCFSPKGRAPNTTAAMCVHLSFFHSFTSQS